MNAYLAYYGSKNTKIYANTSLDAHEKACAFFRVPKSKQHMVSVHLVDKGGRHVTQVLTS